ncbi:MAG: glycosyl hydrolase, partial [Vicinamibacteria bacterium]
TFRLINKERKHRQRAWYYTHVYADPLDENTVYALNTAFYKSVDGGKTYESIPVPHGDNHDLWLNPKNPKILINSNDGGANVSLNGGKTWSTQSNQPTAEFYRVSTDNQFPYRVYGAQQDNSTVSIASRTASGGITVQNWYPVGGGESGHIAVDPRDANIVYAGSYGGTITRYDHRTGYRRNILDYPQLQLGQAPRDMKYRFQWNAPIRISPHDPNVLYHASNVVHKSTNEGQSWEVISPDLTRNDKERQDYSGGPLTWDNTGVEVYGTVFALEESSDQAGLLWVGTDDGLVHLSRDGGTNWTDITPEAMPEWGQVNMLELSAFSPGRAFLAVTRYKMDDFRPYILRTNDFGARWELLTNGQNGIPSNHFVRVVREDPGRQGLLYAGTEFGMYVSFNDGETWQSLQLNLPVTPITDMQVKDGDLVVATQGRSFWILDDLTTLQQLTNEVAEAESFLFSPRDTYRMGRAGRTRRRSGIGENPPNGAVIYYYLENSPEDEVTLEILDANDELVRSFSSTEEKEAEPETFFNEGRDEKVSTDAGMNRFAWDLRYPDAEVTEGAIIWGTKQGPRAVPGSYKVRMKVGEWTDTRAFEVKKDPRLATTREDFQEQFDLSMKIRAMVVDTHEAVTRIREIRRQVEDLAERSSKAGRGDNIQEAAKSLNEALTAIEEKLYQTKLESNQDPLNFPPMLDNQILYLYGIVIGSEAKPTDGSYTRYDELKRELAEHLNALEKVMATELADFNTLVKEEAVPPVMVPTT